MYMKYTHKTVKISIFFKEDTKKKKLGGIYKIMYIQGCFFQL